MKWLKKAHASPPPLPTVPDDKDERIRLLRKETRDLEIIKGYSAKVEAVNRDTEVNLDKNHYMERLTLAYGLPRSE